MKQNYYEKELDILQRVNRIRNRIIFPKNSIDFASNDYLGMASCKKSFQKTCQKLSKAKFYAPKASIVVNGYHKIHRKFEKKLAKVNGFEEGLMVGSGFLANIALMESLIRKKDILFMDEEYHASGILASKLHNDHNIVYFKHNNIQDLEEKLQNMVYQRAVIAIEGVYSMGGDIASKDFYPLAKKYNALLVVDEAHSSGVIGKNLLGWFDHFNLPIEENHIKMGTLGKAYGSYGAYILASHHIIHYLQNRAKSIVYTTAPSLFDTRLGYENFQLIQKKIKSIRKEINHFQKITTDILGIHTESLIVPIPVQSNQMALDIQSQLLHHGFLVGAIRQPTVEQPILRVILKIDNSTQDLEKLLHLIKELLKQ